EANMLLWRAAPGDVATAHGIAKWLVEESKTHPAVQADAIFTLARAQLARGAIEAAIELARDLNQRLHAAPVEEWEEFSRLVLVEALLRADEPEEANHALRKAFDALVAKARRLNQTAHRQAFLGRIGENVRIAALARERLGRTIPSFPPRPDPSPQA